MHPGATLTLWVALVVVLQTLTGYGLAVAVALSLAGAGWVGFSSLRRLVRRIRFLLLAILILFVWMTPGQALVPGWVVLGPTREGLALGLEHGLRLLGVVGLVALLLGWGGRDFLISGLYALVRPLSFLGFSRDRLAVRLLLVLQWVENPPPGGWRHWLGANQAVSPESLHVHCPALRGRDYWLLLGAVMVLWGAFR